MDLSLGEMENCNLFLGQKPLCSYINLYAACVFLVACVLIAVMDALSQQTVSLCHLPARRSAHFIRAAYDETK